MNSKVCDVTNILATDDKQGVHEEGNHFMNSAGGFLKKCLISKQECWQCPLTKRFPAEAYQTKICFLFVSARVKLRREFSSVICSLYVREID